MCMLRSHRRLEKFAATAMALRLAQLIHDQHHGQGLDRIHAHAQDGLPDIAYGLIVRIESDGIGQTDHLGRQQGFGNNDLRQRGQPDIGIFHCLEYPPTGIQTGRETELAYRLRTERKAECCGGFLCRFDSLCSPSRSHYLD